MVALVGWQKGCNARTPDLDIHRLVCLCGERWRRRKKSELDAGANCLVAESENAVVACPRVGQAVRLPGARCLCLGLDWFLDGNLTA